MLIKVIALLSLVIFSFMLSYWILVFGWGLVVKSWVWIIGGFISHVFLAGITQKVAKEINKDLRRI